ncbi:MAG: LamG-like jellyroll fold domain-containing protein, partial [Planctomycetota bacterium]
DGWSGGDGVQSLSTFTGKVLRIRPNGSIPNDNPFYSATTGAYRAIWALGLRNPYTLTRNPATGELLIGEANGSDKADVLRLERAANYAHQGYGGIGNRRSRWTNGASAGSAMISGGAWYPSSGPFPAQYRGAYFMCLWGTNGANGGPPGQISYVRPATNGAVSAFQTQVGAFDGAGTRLKPVHLRVGPDGALYYLLTSYLTGSGSIERIRYAGGTTVQAPTFQPDGGTFPSALGVSVSSATPGAVVRYTLDGSTPTSGSPVAPALVRITSDATLRARAFLGAAESAVRSADYVVGAAANQPPVVSAGPDQVVEFGQLATLNGAATYDPDGSDLNLSDAWTQVSGPTAYLANADETTAFAYVRELGVYRFRLTVTDGFDSAYDEVEVRVVDCINDVTDGLVARWSLDQGAGATAIDSAAGIWNGALEGPAWSTLSVPNAGSALSFDGANDVLQVGAPDVSGPGFTASAWVRPDDFGVEDARILSKATGTPEQEHFWMLSTVRSGNEHVLRFRLRVDGTTRTLVASGGALRANTWAAVAATWDGARMRVWVDGTEVGSLAATGALSTDPGVPAAIGNQPQGGRAFDGHVDEVRLYSRALSRRELRILAGRTVRGDCRENAARH